MGSWMGPGFESDTGHLSHRSPEEPLLVYAALWQNGPPGARWPSRRHSLKWARIYKTEKCTCAYTNPSGASRSCRGHQAASASQELTFKLPWRNVMKKIGLM